MNYYLPIVPQLFIEIIGQSFTTSEFIITCNISSSVKVELENIELQAWWDGTPLSSINITSLGGGIFNLTLTSILVNPGDSPILLNIAVKEVHHADYYYELKLAVDPEALGNDGDTSPPDGGDGEPEPSGGIPGFDIWILGLISVISVITIVRKKR